MMDISSIGCNKRVKSLFTNKTVLALSDPIAKKLAGNEPVIVSYLSDSRSMLQARVVNNLADSTER